MASNEAIEAAKIHLEQMTKGYKAIARQGHPPSDMPYTVEHHKHGQLARFKWEVDAIAYECYEEDVKALLDEIERMKKIAAHCLDMMQIENYPRVNTYLGILAEGA